MAEDNSRNTDRPDQGSNLDAEARNACGDSCCEATDQEPVQESSASEDARRAARRKILVGGLASAPLILTLTSRPAVGWGGTKTGGWTGTKNCGISGKLSGNVSQPTDTTGCRGCSPTYWKTKDYKCGSYFCVGPPNPITWDGWSACNDYSVPTKWELQQCIYDLKKNYWQNKDKIQRCYDYIQMLDQCPQQEPPTFGSKFSELFGGGCTQDAYKTLMQALWCDDQAPYPPPGTEEVSPLLAHCVAAWCNANEFGKDSFGLSSNEVVSLVQDKYFSDPAGLLNLFEEMNSRG